MKLIRTTTRQASQSHAAAALAVKAALALGLATLATSAAAQTAAAISFPVIDQVLCGFIAYSRSTLAPLIAVIVVILSVVGHWLGSGKMWSMLLNVGLGIGIVMGIGSLIARYSSVGSGCL